MSLSRSAAVVGLVLSLGLGGCGGRGGADGERGGLRLLPRIGGGGAAAQPQAGIGVNTFLWRATLDTLAFMPLASADPYGGVVITDWYVNPEQPSERFKATVYILDTRLRADGLNVTVFKQARDAAGGWTDVAVTPQTEIDIENAILTRARQLRLSTVGA